MGIQLPRYGIADEVVACYPKFAVTSEFRFAPKDSPVKTDDFPIASIRGRLPLWTGATGGRR